MRRPLMLLVLLCLAWPACALAYLERVIVERADGDCRLRVETDEHAKIVRLRMLPEDFTCAISQEAMQSILMESFAKIEPPRLEGEYRALSLGRLMSYPWLIEYLVRTAHNDRRWDRRRGKPVTMDLYAYVREILFNREMIAPFNQALADSGYRVAAVTVEKVCVGQVTDLPFYHGPLLSGKVPVDALVWFYLEKGSPPTEKDESR